MIEKYRKYLTFSLLNRFETKPLEISSGKYFLRAIFILDAVSISEK